MIAMSVARYFDEMSYGPAPEADTEARAWLKRHDATFGHFIDGAFAKPNSGAYIDSMEPASGAKRRAVKRPSARKLTREEEEARVRERLRALGYL